MAAFEYVALDLAGRSRKGILTGDSSRHARALLRDQGLQPVEIRSVDERAVTRSKLRSGDNVSATELAMLTRQLATMLRAAIPLEQALIALGEQVAGRRLQRLVTGVQAEVTEGVALHEALGRFPGAFPPLYRVMVEAGEASGRLEEVLERLADYTEMRQTMRQKLVQALIYPALVTAVAVLVVTALLTYVVPEVVAVFAQTGQQLPLLTRGLIAVSDFLRDYGPGLLGGGVLAALAASWLLRREAVRTATDRLLLAIPLLGRVLRTVEMARLTRTLAILTRSGVPLLEALEIASRTISNRPLRRAIETAGNNVREGGKFHHALAGSGAFPPVLVHMIAAGEDSGELEEMLERVAVQQERELDTIAGVTASIIEPVIILLMAVVVLLIVLAILMPIFEMNQLVSS